MQITYSELEALAADGLITQDQARAIWAALEGRAVNRQRFDLAHAAYYAGALIVISAMGWFLTSAWEALGGWALFSIAAIYALIFAAGGSWLWRRQGLRVPAGLLVTVGVCMTPLATYGLQRGLGVWPDGDPGAYRDYYAWVHGSWIVMELATIAAGAIALGWFRFPFLTAPIAFSLWFLSMDLAPLLLGQEDLSYNGRLWVSLLVGAAMLLVAYVLDYRGTRDYAYWLYLFGTLAFWGGLSLINSNGEWSWLLYCLINVGMILLAVFLRRPVLLVFGGLGVFGYFGHLAYDIFADSLLFPVALTGLGLAVMACGIVYQRNRTAIERRMLGTLPSWALQLRPGAAL